MRLSELNSQLEDERFEKDREIKMLRERLEKLEASHKSERDALEERWRNSRDANARFEKNIADRDELIAELQLRL